MLAPVTAWMFPWERRQMEGAGTPLRTWEKAYWGLFVGGMAVLLYSRLFAEQKKPDPKASGLWLLDYLPAGRQIGPITQK